MDAISFSANFSLAHFAYGVMCARFKMIDLKQEVIIVPTTAGRMRIVNHPEMLVDSR